MKASIHDPLRRTRALATVANSRARNAERAVLSLAQQVIIYLAKPTDNDRELLFEEARFLLELYGDGRPPAGIVRHVRDGGDG